jgi:hypothetical protein
MKITAEMVGTGMAQTKKGFSSLLYKITVPQDLTDIFQYWDYHNLEDGSDRFQDRIVQSKDDSKRQKWQKSEVDSRKGYARARMRKVTVSRYKSDRKR